MNGSTGTPPPTSSTTASSDKLSGQLIIKAQLGDDIRKIMIHNEDLTFNELVLMMERIFAGKISNSDELTIKYLDDDGDKITLLNDSDLTVALNFHKVLRLFVLVNGNEQINTNTTEKLNKEGSLIDAKTFRTELQQIRNSVQAILDRLQLPTNQDLKPNQEKEVTTTTTPTTVPTSAVIASTTREFDPLKHLQQRQRSTTPDSIRSKSSTSNKMINNEQKTFQTAPPLPTVDTQHSYPTSESTDANRPPSTAFPQTQMPTPSNFAPIGFGGEQQAKTSPFGPPPTSFPGMPSLPNQSAVRYPTNFAPPTLPNTNTSSTFNPTSAPPLPPPNAGQTSAFIGQQQQQTPLAPPPQQGGFYGQQAALLQQRPGMSAFNPNNGTNNAFAQQQQQQMPPLPPSSNSSPATINPSVIQSTPMPTPPPLASQQPYGGFQPQTNFYNPTQQYSKMS